MNKAQQDGIVRHVLTLIAGFLVAFKILPEDIVSAAVENVMLIVGGVAGLIAIYKSITAKSKK